MANITVEHEFCGWSDYWGGNGQRWDDNAGCLFAYYDKRTTLRDCVDQWVEEFCAGGDCDSFHEDITAEDIREAILTTLLNDRGRADYEAGALAECAADWASYSDDDEVEEDCESPIWIILVKYDKCPDCDNPSGEETYDELCDSCHKKHYGDEYVV